MFYYLMSLSYDGGDYHGWVIQPHHKTVQGVLNQTIKRVIKSADFMTLGASKTDAGVHALDQKVLFSSQFAPDNLTRFQQALNQALPPTMGINSLISVDRELNFHQLVTSKTYLYTINDQDWSLFDQRYEWRLTKPKLDIPQLQTLCDLFVGRHNFQNFCGLSQKELAQFNPVRTIFKFEVTRNQKGKIVFLIQGQGFLRYQIRMMIGAMIKVSQKRKYQVADLQRLLDQPNQTKIPLLAPAPGLLLAEIVLAEINH